MISDKYILKLGNTEKLLDITEHMAACYGFSGKDLFKIRLITEEMIASLQSGIALTPGELWFGARNGMFVVTSLVSSDPKGMPREQREKLLETVSSKKSPIFGFIQRFFEEAAMADEALSFKGYVQTNCGESQGDSWSIGALNSLSSSKIPASGDESFDEQDLEIRLIKGFADDIRVTDRMDALEMSVYKKIPEDFMKSFMLE